MNVFLGDQTESDKIIGEKRPRVADNYRARSAAAIVEEWQPSSDWAGEVVAARRLIRSWRLGKRLEGWRKLVVMLGDTHVPELCLVGTVKLTIQLPREWSAASPIDLQSALGWSRRP